MAMDGGPVTVPSLLGLPCAKARSSLRREAACAARICRALTTVCIPQNIKLQRLAEKELLPCSVFLPSATTTLIFPHHVPNVRKRTHCGFGLQKSDHQKPMGRLTREHLVLSRLYPRSDRGRHTVWCTCQGAHPHFAKFAVLKGNLWPLR